MANYGVVYRLDFCNVLDVKKRIDILKKDYTGGITYVTGSGNPISITYKNEDDDKFEEVTTSEATVRLLAESDNFNLKTFYLEDERGWMVKHYTGDAYNLEWSGFVIPDNSSEPFSYYPYVFELKASDQLGTLKDLPYYKDNALIRKVDSFKNILIECLNKTDLGLDYVLSSNTYEQRMATGDNDCPLEQTFIDTNRFIDENNKPYSCLDIIEIICRQFTANLKQVGGRWYFVDQSQRELASFVARSYSNAGVKTGNFTISNLVKNALADNLVNHDHSFENEAAYKTVTYYYQFGYLSNVLNNGDFNIVNPLVVAQRFPGWAQVGGISLNYGQKHINTQTGQLLIEDYYAIIKNSHHLTPNRFLVSDGVPLLTTQKAGVSLSVSAPNIGLEDAPKAAHLQFTFSLILTAADGRQAWWNGGEWLLSGTNLQLDQSIDDVRRGTTINFSTNYPPFEGSVSLGIAGAEVRPYTNLDVEIFFDDAKLSFDESQYYKSPIGYVNQLTNFYNYSKAPDAIVLMFGDDVNVNRTSWMRLSDNSNTLVWKKKGEPDSAYKSLQRILNRNILSQHRKPSRRFEGSLRGDFSPIDTIGIQLVDGKFSFLSGTYDIKSATAKLVLAEVFQGTYLDFNEIEFQDTGDFKNSTGTAVGSPNGVSIPPTNGGFDPTRFIQNQAEHQVDAQFNVKKGVFKDALIVPVSSPVLEAGQAGLWIGSLSGVTDNPGGGGGGSSTFAGLTDVSLSSLVAGQIPVFNGSVWINQSINVDLSNYYNKTQVDTKFAGLGGLAYRNNINGNEAFTEIGNRLIDIGISQFMRWKNYGNGHIIFDASAGTAPNGAAISESNSQNVWQATFPTLMGWNGVNTYGVRVDRARYADSANETLQSVASRGNVYTGNIGIAYDGVPIDPHGAFEVTRAGAGSPNLSYYGLTRSGQIGWGMGIDTGNQLIWGNPSPLSTNGAQIPTALMSLSSAGDLGSAGRVAAGSGGFKSFTFKGLAGDYDQNGTSDKIIWTIGDGWNTIDNMYGIGYSFGTKYSNGTHQIVFRHGNSITSAIDLTYGNARFDGEVRGAVIQALSALKVPIVAPNLNSGEAAIWIGNLSGITN